MNEDFIVSNEELKANQARVIAKEEEAKEIKRDRIKELFLIVFIGGLFLVLAACIYKSNEEDIATCIKNGGTEQFCVNALMGN